MGSRARLVVGKSTRGNSPEGKQGTGHVGSPQAEGYLRLAEAQRPRRLEDGCTEVGVPHELRRFIPIRLTAFAWGMMKLFSGEMNRVSVAW